MHILHHVGSNLPFLHSIICIITIHMHCRFGDEIVDFHSHNLNLDHFIHSVPSVKDYLIQGCAPLSPFLSPSVFSVSFFTKSNILGIQRMFPLPEGDSLLS